MEPMKYMFELKLFTYEHEPKSVTAWGNRKSERVVKIEKLRLNILSKTTFHLVSVNFWIFHCYTIACHCKLPQKWQQLSLRISLLFDFLSECLLQTFSWNEFVRGTILVYCLLKIILRLIWAFFYYDCAWIFS